MLDKNIIIAALKEIHDPELHRSIVELDMVKDVSISDGYVKVEILLTIAGCPLQKKINSDINTKLMALAGVDKVDVKLEVMNDQQRAALRQKLSGGVKTAPLFGGRRPKQIIAVASGKGGVGKSTVTANLAVALAQTGATVGVLDADVYGFSIPRMLGVQGQPTVVGEMIIPIERNGIRVISMGFFVDEDAPIIWRGPMLHKAIQQFMTDVHWGELDYLLIDLPPGTGDVSLTIAQSLPEARLIVVTTPQPAATNVAVRVARLAERTHLKVMGVIENMSYYITPQGEQIAIFGNGGGQHLADLLAVPLLGQIPLEPLLREGSDKGKPIVEHHKNLPAGRVILEIAARINAFVDAGT